MIEMSALKTILVVFLLVNLGESKKDCSIDCSDQSKKPVCAKNGKTYESFCVFQKESCLEVEPVEFDCDGACPCDPAEVIAMDEDTVKIIHDARTVEQLKRHENEQNEIINKIIESREREEHLKSVTANRFNKECSPHEMSDLPARLVDWFHVLRVNERVSEMKDQRIEKEPVMVGQSFKEEKLRAIYSQLSCAEQHTKEIEEKVCLNPVKWMFTRLDGDGDESLSSDELTEIEHIKAEHCIKPFFDKCDTNNDHKVGLAEFCKCLCVTPPCTRVIKDIPILMLRGLPVPARPDMFIPKCDDDGFFMPEQCDNNECWCVGRHGSEIAGTRNVKGAARCGAYNTDERMGKPSSGGKKKE